MNTKKITETALLIALSVILTRFLSLKLSFYGIDGVRLGFGALPIMLAGLRYGPLEGAKVGALADIVGYFLSPGGVYMPHFTLTSALNGFLPPIIAGRGKELSIYRVLFSVAVTQTVTALLLVPYFLHLLFGMPYRLIMPPRGISVLINIFLFNAAVLVLHKRINIFRQEVWPRDLNDSERLTKC